jgi:CRP-like cAMP-binding protein
MQIKGHGWQLAAADLLQLVDAMPDLKRMCLLFSQALTTQIANALLAAAKFRIQQRLARWLLMCHDRTKGDTLSLTHEFLALMLAVRRSGVTTELHILEGKGLIRATRGRITMLDREGLIEIAAGCYGVPEREYERLFPPLRRH